MDNLGERIKSVRKKKKLTQKKFAEKLGISQTHISKIEKGVENPSETLIKFISYLYCIDYEWLKTGNGTPDLKLSGEIDGLINNYYLIREEFEKPIEEMNSDILYEFIHTYLSFSKTMTAPTLESKKYKWDPQLYVSYYEYMNRLMFALDWSVRNTFETMVDNQNIKELDIIEHKKMCDRSLETIKKYYTALIELILKFEKD